MNAAEKYDAGPLAEARNKSLRWGKAVWTASEAMAPRAEGIGTKTGDGLPKRHCSSSLSQRLPLCEESEVRARNALRR